MSSSSIFNHVLGPVMHGPSSSHTAASFHIGRMARSILGCEPAEVEFAFDPSGSYAEVYAQQGSDKAFAMGVMGWDITDSRFSQALVSAKDAGVKITFAVRPLQEQGHPNIVEVALTGEDCRKVRACARSVGGGAVVFTSIDGSLLSLKGDAWELILLAGEESLPGLRSAAERLTLAPGYPEERHQQGGGVLFHARCLDSPPPGVVDRMKAERGVVNSTLAEPIFFPLRGKALFKSALEMTAFAEKENISLGEAGIRYEAALLGLSREEVIGEMIRRFRVMEDSVREGLSGKDLPMKLLRPVAGKIMKAEANGSLAIGGIHTRAAARAMAVMHVNGAGGLVCAAPTGGSAGTIPGVAVTLKEEMGLADEDIARVLFAASVVGVIVSERATFAAEVAGCQVEIGAAGAMAAAGVVEFAGGGAAHACSAAAIFFQNWMGSVCDPVQGYVEIPCHTRNAVAASSAFVCADLVLGGYENPLPLDETIDAVLAVGKMLPRELRCTVLGGLSLCPSAKAMKVRN
ncbi:MAG: L-serine ammonia-lyase, iron-sulfur-dependent, subunit alpha [Thermovirgaceae bacterium]|nr:L-serine ammonia-lyase, iron-sulfur-dependent, subunit alpha [Thermovirgaceae bacterium]